MTVVPSLITFGNDSNDLPLRINALVQRKKAV